MMLECVKKEFSSRPYASACPTEIESPRNLTERLTPDLTKRLTGYLKVALTFSAAQEVSESQEVVSQSILASSPLTCRTSLGLRTLQGESSCRGTGTSE